MREFRFICQCKKTQLNNVFQPISGSVLVVEIVSIGSTGLNLPSVSILNYHSSVFLDPTLFRIAYDMVYKVQNDQKWIVVSMHFLFLSVSLPVCVSLKLLSHSYDSSRIDAVYKYMLINPRYKKANQTIMHARQTTKCDLGRMWRLHPCNLIIIKNIKSF